MPTTLSNKVTCATDDAEFHGMSTFMSARSTLSWDLGKEAFVTYFNIGNGKFFNWKGERQNDNEWYNLGAQDFMPTWRWWWSSKFLGKDAADVPASGLTAAISWDDAYVGGSTVRITGSSTPAEYLQLLKTQFALKAGDVLTFTYKLAGGSANVAVAMSTERKESTVALELPVCETSQLSDDTEWVTKTYEVKAGDGLAGKTLAVVALKFDAATNLDFYLGELSIRRGALAAPVTPESPEVKVLRSHYAGIDAKLIFNVPNSKPADQVCYNDEVGTSIFKIWSQEEGKEAVLLGMTPSWAYLAYSAPFSGDKDGNGKIRFGVQSVSLDWNSESEIQWSDYVASGERAYSDQITVDKTTITPGEEFTLSTVDPKRSYKWQIWTAGDNSRMVAESPSSTNSWTCEGLEEMTTYDVKCIGTNNTGAESITYSLFLVVTNPSAGRLPEILTLTANGKDADIEVLTGNEVKLEYTGRPANGIASRGIELEEKFFGIKASEIMDGQDESFSIAGWLKITNFPGDVEWIDVRNPNGTWPRNNWGWLWTNISQDGTIYDFHHELSASNGAGGIDKVLVYDFGNGKNTFFNPGQWTHFAFTFERSQEKCRTIIYINGKRIESTWKYYTNAGDNYNPTGTPAQQGGTEDYLQAYKALDLNSYISICGTRHTGRGAGLGFTGVLDDFQIWNKAMTQDEVNASMAGLDGNNLPDGVLAFFDFEQDPGSDNMFVAKGKKTGAKAGYYQLGSGNTEGQGVIEYLKPNFMSGCPFIPGVDYKIETTPSWSVNKATLTGAQGTDEAGSVTATYSLPGEYTARLTLSNDLGSDSRTFQVIKVGEEGGINEIGAANMRTYTVDDQLFLEVAQSGNYAVSIYDLSGRQLAAKAERIEGGSYMRLTFRGLPGTYVVNVTRDGRPARAFKVIKK